VNRHPLVKISAFDTDGKQLSFQVDGFHARVIQHEYDHLDGVVFLDRMKGMDSLMFEEEWDRYAPDKDLPVEV
jgi:peptide deformylase